MPLHPPMPKIIEINFTSKSDIELFFRLILRIHWSTAKEFMSETLLLSQIINAKVYDAGARASIENNNGVLYYDSEIVSVFGGNRGHSVRLFLSRKLHYFGWIHFL